MTLAQVLELAGVVLLLAGIAWLLGVLLPVPFGWPAGVALFGAGLVLAAYLMTPKRKGNRR